MFSGAPPFSLPHNLARFVYVAPPLFETSIIRESVFVNQGEYDLSNVKYVPAAVAANLNVTSD